MDAPQPPEPRRHWPIRTLILVLAAALALAGIGLYAIWQFLGIIGCIMMLGLPAECGRW